MTSKLVRAFLMLLNGGVTTKVCMRDPLSVCRHHLHPGTEAVEEGHAPGQNLCHANGLVRASPLYVHCMTPWSMSPVQSCCIQLSTPYLGRRQECFLLLLHVRLFILRSSNLLQGRDCAAARSRGGNDWYTSHAEPGRRCCPDVHPL